MSLHLVEMWEENDDVVALLVGFAFGKRFPRKKSLDALTLLHQKTRAQRVAIGSCIWTVQAVQGARNPPDTGGDND